ncbi:MAG TPA: tyrosine-type recombinase/integrase [Polyangiaceae bacterium]
MATSKRRIRSPHPGVVLVRPETNGRHPYWRARYVDPDTGKYANPSLADLPTAEARRDWAIRKSRALAKRRMDLDAGAHRATGTKLADAIGRYFKDHPQLRPKTLEVYKAAGDKLTAWAERTRVHSADDLTGPKLVAFRAELVREPRRARAKGGKRGQMKPTDKTRSPHTINRELRSVSTILSYVRRLGLLPYVTGDDLRDSWQRLAVGSERIDYRKPAELRKLLDAALRHDADAFKATRNEHAGKRKAGTTPRHQAIAPFVACVLLSGMRFGEVIDLEWKNVDLEALDNEGRTVGEIHLSSATKTKKARTVGLEVSPALRKLLAAMHLKSEKKGSVFTLTRDAANTALRRLQKEYGAPTGAGWQALRRTCGTFLTNAPGIFGAASAYRSAKQLGHSVAVAEKHYVDVARGIQRDARNLETAMQVSAEVQRVTESCGPRLPAIAAHVKA